MPTLRRLAPALFLLAAACGGEGASLSGSLHPSLLGDGAGWTVWAEEAERETAVRDGKFELKELAPGPVHLQLRREGDPVGRISVPGLTPGTGVRLMELRVEPRSGLAFPSAVEVDGGGVVWVNGIRMAPSGTVPDSVDVRGAVLALEPGAGVMLFRPDDERLPDLRVVAGPRTAPLTVDDLAAGDSLRIAGRLERDYVVVSLLEPAGVPDDGDAGDVGEDESAADDLSSADQESTTDTPPSAGWTPPAAASAPAARESPAASAVSRAPPAGRGRDDRGKGRGRGNGKAKGKGGKKQD